MGTRVERLPDGSWQLNRHADCVRLLLHARCGVRTTEGLLPAGEAPRGLRGEWLLYQDPPKHTRLRRNVAQLFTPHAAERWRAKLSPLVDELLATLGRRTDMDIVADMAVPVRAALVCELFAIPDADRAWFGPTSLSATRVLAGGSLPEPARAEAQRASTELADYLERLIDRRRLVPDGNDLISALLRAERDHRETSPHDLPVQTIGHLLSGFETVGFLANAVGDLIRHPQELARLQERPSMVPSAVEECLRYNAPLGATSRFLHEATWFDEHRIPADVPVTASLWAANRDGAVFTDPDRFDVTRHANAHLAFGAGNHICIGQHFARVESHVVIEALLRHLDDLVLLDGDAVEWSPLPLRVPERLRVGFRRIGSR